MNFQDMMQAVMSQQSQGSPGPAGMRQLPPTQGYAEYMPERMRPEGAPMGSEMSPDMAQGGQMLQMFMQDPQMRSLLLQALFKIIPGMMGGQPAGPPGMQQGGPPPPMPGPQGMSAGVPPGM